MVCGVSEDGEDDEELEEIGGGVGEGEVVKIEGGDERSVKRMLDPRLPTAEEVEDHYRTHCPYRNWCPHCVKGRAKSAGHSDG